jgi:hypothetical protein
MTDDSCHGEGKLCSICGVWNPMDEYNYGNRENRSYCTTCDKEGSLAKSVQTHRFRQFTKCMI